jgi:acetolactate synthase I/II/III large subunit
MTTSTETTVATEIAATFKTLGVDRLFLLTGGDQPLWIALRDAGIKMVVGRSEASAVYMADGYARASGNVAATYGQAGPGAANVAAALADAHWAQSPVFALTGATATDALHASEYQDIDQHTMFAPVTKWNGRATDAQQVARLVRQGLDAAAAQSSGPTHLDVPKNYFGSKVAHSVAKQRLDVIETAVGKVPAVEQIADALRNAQRPIVLVGEGVRFANAGDEVSAMAKAAGIPIVVTMGGKPSILTAHPNYCGVVGRYSAVTANNLLAKADCVLALGTRLGGLATNGYTLGSRAAVLIQVDHDDAAFIGKYQPDLAVKADIRAMGPALRKLFDASGPVASQSWLNACTASTAEWRGYLARKVHEATDAKQLSPLVVLDEIGKFAGEVTVVADTGYMAAWTGVLFPVARQNAYFRAVGSLGWALPASIGVQMARREKVVCITGDGGAGYHLADIETAVRYKSPLVIVVMDNLSLAFEYHEQKYRWNGNVVPEANDFTAVDFALAAKALGANGLTATNRDSLRAAVKTALEADWPTVIHALVDKEAFPPVTNFDAVMERRI